MPVPCRSNAARAVNLSLATTFRLPFTSELHLTTICTLTGAPGTIVAQVPPGGSFRRNAIEPDVIGVAVFGAVGRPVHASRVPVSVHLVLFVAGVATSPFTIFTAPRFFGDFPGCDTPA